MTTEIPALCSHQLCELLCGYSIISVINPVPRWLLSEPTENPANSVPKEKVAQVFLTNQTMPAYKLLTTLAGQQMPSKDINKLTMEITAFMDSQFNPKRFTIQERFNFWSDTKCKPDETVQGLAARIHQDAAKCDFTSIKDPQDEAMQTCFICTINNEAVLKAVFKINNDELTFARAIQVALETEDAAKVAKEAVYGSMGEAVLQLQSNGNQPTKLTAGKQQPAWCRTFPRGTCPLCKGLSCHFL